MKISLLCAAAALSTLSATAHAQSRPEDLQAKALSDDTAYDIIEGLTTEIGPRMAGTEREAAARAWMVERLTGLGFSNVRIQPFSMPTWVRGEETASVIAPFEQRLTIATLGNSASTGEQGIEAELVYFPTLADLVAAPDGSLTGKIAFVSHAMTRTQDGSSYGAFGGARFTGPSIAAKKGAAAIVIRSIGTDNHRMPHTGSTNFAAGVKPIPAGALSIPDADNLVRMARIAKERGQPLKLRLKLTPRNLGQQMSGNVLAEIPGSDPAAGIVLAACHLDSWDLGTGAIDDASGCGIIAGAAKLVKEGGQPRRTIRLLMAGAEEVGIFGGKAYAEANSADKHAFAMESDFGADRIWKAEFTLGAAYAGLADQAGRALAPLGIARGTGTANGGADVSAIIALQKPAIIDLRQDGTHYFDLHHTADDTLDKVDPAAVQQNVAAWATMLSLAANAPETTAQ